MEEPVKVCIRIRPVFPHQKNTKDFSVAVQSTDEYSLNLTYPRNTVRPFYYDRIFNERSSDAQIFSESSSEVIQSFLQGYNTTIFVYGQTGTGKTHTMGILRKLTPRSEGLIPYALKQIFSQQVTVNLSFLQIYLDNIYDLLNNNKKSLQVRQSNSGGIFVKDLTQVPVSTYAQASNLVNAGLANRILGSHNANQTSSRSHLVLTLEMKSGAKLTMIDLAGSERVRATSSSGVRLQEAKFINASLSALGNVIGALTSGNLSHVPFRDSKLTRLLQPSLNGKMVLIATVGPTFLHGQQTLGTLQFASRCKEVVTVPVIEIQQQKQFQRTPQDSIATKVQQDDFLVPSFNHTHSEVIYYLVRLLSSITQNSIKLVQQVQSARNSIQPLQRASVQQKFPFNFTGNSKSLDLPFANDLIMQIESMNSSEVVQKLQPTAKKLIENINLLGKSAIDAQYMKGALTGKHLGDFPGVSFEPIAIPELPTRPKMQSQKSPVPSRQSSISKSPLVNQTSVSQAKVPSKTPPPARRPVKPGLNRSTAPSKNGRLVQNKNLPRSASRQNTQVPERNREQVLATPPPSIPRTKSTFTRPVIGQDNFIEQLEKEIQEMTGNSTWFMTDIPLPQQMRL